MSPGDVRLGAWTHQPRAAYADADPYTRARRARDGVSPLSQAEGLSFIARRDASGEPLRPTCDYVIAGRPLAARLWTLSVLTPDGRPAHAPAGPASISSAEIVRDQEGRFMVLASAKARPGNWLALPDEERFVLLLRLYDTTGSATAGVLSADQLPTLRPERCA